MATQTLPYVVPSPQIVPAEPITQLELELFLSLRNKLANLEKQVAVEETALRCRIEAGATVDPGVHVAELKEHSRRNVAWKAVVVRLAVRLKMDGEAYCDRVLAATKPTKTFSLEVH